MTIKMTDQDYELLSRYLDRELSPADASSLERRLASEPELQRGFERMGAVQRRLRGAFRHLDKEPVPDRITALLQGGPVQIQSLPHRMQAPQRYASWGLAVAASLVVAISATLISRPGQQAGSPTGGVDAVLAKALESTPSRGSGWETLEDGRALRPVLSFQHKTGNWCREYLVTAGDDSWHGVACRDDRGWATAVLAAEELADSSAEYRPAGASDSTRPATRLPGAD